MQNTFSFKTQLVLNTWARFGMTVGSKVVGCMLAVSCTEQQLEVVVKVHVLPMPSLLSQRVDLSVNIRRG
jgi:hypothetical protein